MLILLGVLNLTGMLQWIKRIRFLFPAAMPEAVHSHPHKVTATACTLTLIHITPRLTCTRPPKHH